MRLLLPLFTIIRLPGESFELALSIIWPNNGSLEQLKSANQVD